MEHYTIVFWTVHYLTKRWGYPICEPSRKPHLPKDTNQPAYGISKHASSIMVPIIHRQSKSHWRAKGKANICLG